MSDTQVPCVCCGQPSSVGHHTAPRGRSGGKAAAERAGPVVRLCVACDAMMIPEGSWNVRREGDEWVTFDPTGELSRRPAEVKGSQALVVIQRVGDLLDPRGEKTNLLALFRFVSDNDLRLLDEYGMRMAAGGARIRALAQYHAYLRYPWKDAPNWAEKLAESFGVSAKTIYENVRAAALYAQTDGPTMAWSYYVAASHSPEPPEAVKVAQAMWEQSATVAQVRAALKGESGDPDWCLCPACGDRHIEKKHG